MYFYITNGMRTKKAGSAVITVKTTDGSKKKVKLKVTVRPEKPVNFIAQKKGKKKSMIASTTSVKE